MRLNNKLIATKDGTLSKTMITKQALGNLLFGMADILRDKVEDYKSYILSLLFFKRLSDNYQWETENGINEYVAANACEPSARELEVIARKRHDFLIPKGCFWEDVRKASIDKKNEALDKAVAAIADQNVDKNGKYILKGIINFLRNYCFHLISYLFEARKANGAIVLLTKTFPSTGELSRLQLS